MGACRKVRELGDVKGLRTLRNQCEKGRAWSRPSAQACLDAAAMALREVHTLRIMGIKVMQTVPSRLPVADRKT